MEWSGWMVMASIEPMTSTGWWHRSVKGAPTSCLGHATRPTQRSRGGSARVFKRTLAACLSKLTGRRVTDPTSGFCALGPRAVRLLADHHPTGYPEPELHLFVSRHELRVVEVPIRSRERLGGRTSLTRWRMVQAAARVALAMVIVPLRNRLGDIDGD